jgi:hypothetical protein
MIRHEQNRDNELTLHTSVIVGFIVFFASVCAINAVRFQIAYQESLDVKVELDRVKNSNREMAKELDLYRASYLICS